MGIWSYCGNVCDGYNDGNYILGLFLGLCVFNKKDRKMTIYLILLHIISAFVGCLLAVANWMIVRKNGPVFGLKEFTLGDVVLFIVCGFVIIGNIIAVCF